MARLYWQKPQLPDGADCCSSTRLTGIMARNHAARLNGNDLQGFVRGCARGMRYTAEPVYEYGQHKEARGRAVLAPEYGFAAGPVA